MTDKNSTAATVTELTTSYLSVLGHASTFGNAWLRETEEGSLSLTVTRAVRDIDENAMRSFVEIHSIDEENKSNPWRKHTLSPVPLSPKPVLFDNSPKRGITVSFYNSSFLNKTPLNGGSFVEIQCPMNGLYRVDLSGTHGKVVGDAWFGGISWSQDERFVVYVAQCKPEENKNKTAILALDEKNAINPEKCVFSSAFSEREGEREGDEKKETLSLASKFDFVEDWGEKYVDVSALSLFVLDLHTSRVLQVPGIDVERLTVGQPVFVSPSLSRGGECRVAYTAWHNAPRRLGMIYCYQRSCRILCSTDLSSYLLGECESERESAKKAILSLSPSLSGTLCVSEGLALARSPRVSPDGETLVFLGHETGFLSHNGCVALYKVNTRSLFAQRETERDTPLCERVVDVVDNPLTALSHNAALSEREMPFPGLFCDQLPRRCFVSLSQRVLLTSSWAGREALLCVSLSRKNDLREVLWHTEEHREGEGIPSIQLLDVLASAQGERETERETERDRVVASVSTPTTPPRLIYFSVSVKEGKIKKTLSVRALLRDPSKTTRFNASHKFSAPLCHASSLSLCVVGRGVQWKVFQHVAEDGVPFSSFILFPTTEREGEGEKKDLPKTRLPIVLVPHGGPHSVTPTSFIASYYFLCVALQAVVVHVNYRGSVGFGQRSVESLLGHVGENDVKDMIFALRHAQALVVERGSGAVVKRGEGEVCDGDELLASGKVAVVGGSHGGFLGAHLCGQFPALFSACALRNPVTDVSAMTGVTDIPDWCFVEALPDCCAEIAHRDIPTAEDLLAMRRVSPVHYIEQYKTPTLICLGAKDRRVPPSQGIAFYHALRRRQVATRLMIFPEDVHAIDLPASEAEHWIAIAHWLKTHMQL